MSTIPPTTTGPHPPVALAQAMAEAVEDASLVVMGLSPEYKDSQACRTEGE